MAIQKSFIFGLIQAGVKTFFILHKGKTQKLKEFIQGEYMVEHARADALKIVKRIEHSSVLKSNKYSIGALFDSYIKQKTSHINAKLYAKNNKSDANLYTT